MREDVTVRTILVVIPTYNEAQNIRPLIHQLFEVASKLDGKALSVLIVDDESPDGTARVVRSLQKTYPALHLISGPKNGLGNAYQRGLTHGLKTGKYDAFVTMDGDLSHDPSAIPSLIKEIDAGADYVIGSRYVPGGAIKGWPLRRKVNSFVANLLARKFMGIKDSARDLTSGFRAIRGTTLRAINLSDIRATGYVFQTNVLYEVWAGKFIIREIPITFSNRRQGKSKMRPRDVMEFICLTYRLNPNRKVVLAFKIGIIFGLFWLSGWRRLDPDFGWHLMTGDYIRQFGVPAKDIFSYSASAFPWINHEWGNDVLASLIYQYGGYGIVAAFYASLWTGAMLISGTKARLGILLISVATVLPYAGIRPLSWTVLFLAILLKLIQHNSKRANTAIGLMFLLWVNVHAGFIIGFIVLGFYGLKQLRLSWFYLLAACVVISFINPYGPGIYIEIFRTILDPSLHSQVQEWQAFSLSITAIMFIVLWLAGFWMFDRKKRANWVSLSGLLIAASLSATRNIPLLVITATSELDDYYGRLKQMLPSGLDKPRRAVLGLLAAFIIGGAGFGLITNYLPWSNNRGFYPVQAVDYLKSYPCPGRVFNDYNWGGYMVWQLPGEKVYIDGRMPSWKDPEGKKYMDRYLAIMADSKARDREFKQYDIQCVLLSTNWDSRKMTDGLVKAGWQVAFRTDRSLLLVAPSR